MVRRKVRTNQSTIRPFSEPNSFSGPIPSTPLDPRLRRGSLWEPGATTTSSWTDIDPPRNASLAELKKPITSLSPELAEVVLFAKAQGAKAVGGDVMLPADREDLVDRGSCFSATAVDQTERHADHEGSGGSGAAALQPDRLSDPAAPRRPLYSGRAARGGFELMPPTSLSAAVRQVRKLAAPGDTAAASGTHLL